MTTISYDHRLCVGLQPHESAFRVQCAKQKFQTNNPGYKSQPKSLKSTFFLEHSISYVEHLIILRTFTPCISCCDVLFHSFRTWDCRKTGEIANGGDFGAKPSRVGPETPPVRRTSTDSSTGCCRRPAEIKKERLIIFPMGVPHAYVVSHTV